jgi:hypothetical protein
MSGVRLGLCAPRAWRAARRDEKGGEERALMKRRRFKDDDRMSSYVPALFDFKKLMVS